MIRAGSIWHGSKTSGSCLFIVTCDSVDMPILGPRAKASGRRTKRDWGDFALRPAENFLKMKVETPAI
jgi:hypothetical protein